MVSLGVNLSKTTKVLTGFISRAIEMNIEPVRIARSTVAILSLSKQAVSNTIKQSIARFLKRKTVNTGGWSDPEETAWCLASLEKLNTRTGANVEAARVWLEATRHPRGGWGRHSRDMRRIVTTGLVVALLPEVANQSDRQWIRKEWEKELCGVVKLCYKGGFYLLAEKRDAETALPDATIRFLEQDQNDDGGFGPWKNHPVGSDPWSTGIVLWGLSCWIDRVDKSVVERALAWLEKTQLPSGYWPYHYLDEGTSYALIGAVSALKALQRL